MATRSVETRDLKLEPRGPTRFDRWTTSKKFHTELGQLVVTIKTRADAKPDDGMLDAANELVTFAETHGSELLDLIYGHYLLAQEEGWLEFWSVPLGLSRSDAVKRLGAVALNVNGFSGAEAVVFVDPPWDPEHKLSLAVEKGRVARINGENFRLDGGGVLRLG